MASLEQVPCKPQTNGKSVCKVDGKNEGEDTFSANITGTESAVSRIQKEGNKPGDWLNYILSVIQHRKFLNEIVKTTCINKLFLKAAKVTPDPEKKTEAYAYLLLEYANFKRTTGEMEAAQELYQDARYECKRFAFVHVAAAQFEITQGNIEKARKILQRGMTATESNCLIKTAYTNLVMGKMELLDSADKLKYSWKGECSAKVTDRQSQVLKENQKCNSQAATSEAQNSSELSDSSTLKATCYGLPSLLSSSSGVRHHSEIGIMRTGDAGLAAGSEDQSGDVAMLSDLLKPVSMGVQSKVNAEGDTLGKKPTEFSENAEITETHSFNLKSSTRFEPTPRRPDPAPDYPRAQGNVSRGLRHFHSTPDCKESSIMRDTLPKLSTAKKRNLVPPSRVPRKKPLDKVVETVDGASPVKANKMEPCDAELSLQINHHIKPMMGSLSPDRTGDQAKNTKQEAAGTKQDDRNARQDVGSRKIDRREEPVTAVNRKFKTALRFEHLPGPEVPGELPALPFKAEEQQEAGRAERKETLKSAGGRQERGAVGGGGLLLSNSVPGGAPAISDIHVPETVDRKPNKDGDSGFQSDRPGPTPSPSPPITALAKHKLAPASSAVDKENMVPVKKPVFQQPSEPQATPSAVHQPVQAMFQSTTPAVPTPGCPITIKGQSYTVLRLLGKGGFSKVYQCIDSGGTLYAIKCISLEDIDVQSYMNEIEVLQCLQHSHRVIKLYQYEVQTCYLFMVMEAGEKDLASYLRSRMKDGQISRELRFFYWKEMLHCVQVLHKQGIVHADLKPANFLLVSGDLKLIDFGIAKSVPHDNTSITTDQQLGTLNYMSPETLLDIGGSQRRDEEGRLQPRLKIGVKSDVWSLGCILYFMLYGKTPFSFIDNQFAKLRAITDNSVVIPFPAHDETKLMEIAKKCLQRDPRNRPSIDDLLLMDTL